MHLLNTFIRREHTFIELSEASAQDRDAIVEVLSLLNIPTKVAPPTTTPTLSMTSRSRDSLSSHSPARSTASASSQKHGRYGQDETPEDNIKQNMMKMRNLVCAMEELICILKSG